MNMALNSDFKTIREHMGNAGQNKRRLFLIDETDKFIEAQAQKGYETLHLFRGLSEEGRCYFILAGFWGLYHAATFDYQSPVKNFAETLTIGALEPDACRDLATKPMNLLNVGYESDDMIETMLHETGRRANLIAIACDEMLKTLESRDRRTLTRRDLETALDSSAIRSSLGGWGAFSGNEKSDRIDRIIVYATIGMEAFTMGELLKLLDHHRFKYEAEQVKQSLERLELGFVLRREKERYSYCVPMFEKMVLAQEPETLLRQELMAG